MKKFFSYAIFSLLPLIASAEKPGRADAHSEAFVPMKAEVALQKLQEGNTRYKKLKQTREGLAEGDRLRLVGEQHPHTIILSCSDSRVPPEIVFDQRLGDLFVVRTAGEVLDKAALASIEYALVHLHSRLLVVMGHESCGAVKAAVNTPEEKSAGSESLDFLLDGIRPSLKGVSSSPTLLNESSANAKAIAKQLEDPKTSEILSKAVANGELQVRSAIYHLGTGTVEFHEKAPR